MTTSVTRSCFAKHQNCKTKTKTKTDFWSLTGLVLRLTVSDHITGTDDKLFDLFFSRNVDHVLHEPLPERVDITYNMRSRSRERVIPEMTGHLAKKNFITRMLYKSAY